MTLEDGQVEAGAETSQVEATASQVELPAAPAVAEEASASPAETDDTRSLAEKVRDDFHKKYGDEATPPAGQEPAPKEAAPTAPEETSTEQKQDDDKATRLPDDVFNALPPEAKRRMGYLTDQARRARKEAETLSAEADTYRGSHDTLMHLQNYISDNAMEAEDVTNSLGMTALFKSGDFAGFVAKMKPFYDFALQAAGMAVAPDVQELVDRGEITSEAGARLTKAEREREVAAGNAQRATATAQQQQQTSARANFVASVKAAVEGQIAALSQSDPDFALKHPAVRDTFRDMLAGGWKPKTPEAAAEMVRNITQRIQVPRPQATPQPTLRRPDGAQPTSTRAVPKTLAEAVLAGYEESLRA